MGTRANMKTIQKEEVFKNLKSFLKTKGIELQDGSYTHRIQQGCGILAETVNLSQEAFHRAKTEVGKGLEKMRQVIHEKTAPKAPPQPAQAGSASAQETSKAEPPPKKPRARAKRSGAKSSRKK